MRTKIETGQYIEQESVTDAMGNEFPTSEQKLTLHVEAGTYTPIVTGDDIERVTVGQASEASTDYAVNLKLDSEGASAFAQATEELAPTKGQIVIILDGVVQSAPAVQGEIPNGDVSDHRRLYAR